MTNFLKDLFTWRGRWNRLKFWIYPLVIIIPTLIILGSISYISLNSYTEDAKNTTVAIQLGTIAKIIVAEQAKGKKLISFTLEDNKINFPILGINKDSFQNPYGEDYLLFIKDDMFQVYGKKSNGINILGNYYQQNEDDSVSLVYINGKYLEEGNYKTTNTSSTASSLIMIILAGIIYILAIWISFGAYVKRLHDLNHSGWWILIFFIPLIGILLFIYCGFFKGTKGENKFGPDPLEKSNNTIAKKVEL